MGRLTKVFDNGVGHQNCFDSCDTCNGVPCELAQAMVDKLAHYEDLEEQLMGSAEIDIDSMIGEFVHDYKLKKENRLIELPCAIGDLVYMIKNMDSLIIPNPNKPPEIIQIMFGHRHIPLIGINVFLTKEEAEAKLEELKGE